MNVITSVTRSNGSTCWLFYFLEELSILRFARGTCRNGYYIYIRKSKVKEARFARLAMRTLG